MAQKNSATDFAIEVDGIGNFIFKKRGMREELRIQAEYSRLTEGVQNPTTYLDLISNWIAVLTVLTVEGPEGWDLMALDPLDPDAYNKMSQIFKALRAKEDSFRPGSKEKSTDGGEDTSQLRRVLVPDEVLPGAK